MALPGCMEDFDNLADKLMTASNAGEKGKVVVEAEKIRDKLPEDKAKKAEIYIKIMHKIVSDGENFLEKETARVKKIMSDGKISETKKKLLEQRTNILKSFARQKSKDEL